MSSSFAHTAPAMFVQITRPTNATSVSGAQRAGRVPARRRGIVIRDATVRAHTPDDVGGGGAVRYVRTSREQGSCRTCHSHYALVRPCGEVLTATSRSSRQPAPAASAPPMPTGPVAHVRSAACSTTLGISADGRVATFAWNTARHLELYFACPVHGSGAAHAQHPAVPRAAHLHRQPRRRRGDLRRSVAPGLARAAPADVRTRASPGAHGRRNRRHPRRAARPRSPRLRGRCSPRPSRSSSTSTTNTAPRACATRAARPATRRACCTATAARSCTRSVR